MDRKNKILVFWKQNILFFLFFFDKYYPVIINYFFSDLINLNIKKGFTHFLEYKQNLLQIRLNNINSKLLL